MNTATPEDLPRFKMLSALRIFMSTFANMKAKAKVWQ